MLLVLVSALNDGIEEICGGGGGGGLDGMGFFTTLVTVRVLIEDVLEIVLLVSMA